MQVQLTNHSFWQQIHALLFCGSITLWFEKKNLLVPQGTLMCSILQQYYQSTVFKTFPLGWSFRLLAIRTHTAPREDVGLAPTSELTAHSNSSPRIQRQPVLQLQAHTPCNTHTLAKQSSTCVYFSPPLLTNIITCYLNSCCILFNSVNN